MGIVAVIAIAVIGIVVALAIGSMANSTHASTWSDEKLQRMYGKLLNASRATTNIEKSKEYLHKAQEVKQEIEKRKTHAAEQVATTLADHLAPTIEEVTKKTIEVVEKTMREENVEFDEAHRIVGTRLREANKKFLEQGLTEEQANAAAMKKIFDVQID